MPKVTGVNGNTYASATRRIEGRPDDQRWDARCSCGFNTREWPSRRLAEARIAEHMAEHESGEPMRELHAFREEHGLNGGPPPEPTIDWED